MAPTHWHDLPRDNVAIESEGPSVPRETRMRRSTSYLIALACMVMIAVGLYHRDDLASFAAPLNSGKRGDATATSMAADIVNATDAGRLEPSVPPGSPEGQDVGLTNSKSDESGRVAAQTLAPSYAQDSAQDQRHPHGFIEQGATPSVLETAKPENSDAKKSYDLALLRLTQELAEARDQLSESIASYRRALEQERAHSASLERELAERQRNDASRRMPSDAQSAKENTKTSADIDGQSIEAERTAALEISKIKALLDVVSADATERPGHEKQADQQLNADAASRRGISSELSEIPDRATDGPRNVPRDQVERASALLDAPNHSAFAPLPPADLNALLSKAKAYLDRGDIGAARSILEHASNKGSAQASFALAETFDPRRLSAWKTRGTRGDVERARELYAKAYAGGINQAAERIAALKL